MRTEYLALALILSSCVEPAQLAGEPDTTEAETLVVWNDDESGEVVEQLQQMLAINWEEFSCQMTSRPIAAEQFAEENGATIIDSAPFCSVRGELWYYRSRVRLPAEGLLLTIYELPDGTRLESDVDDRVLALDRDERARLGPLWATDYQRIQSEPSLALETQPLAFQFEVGVTVDSPAVQRLVGLGFVAVERWGRIDVTGEARLADLWSFLLRDHPLEIREFDWNLPLADGAIASWAAESNEVVGTIAEATASNESESGGINPEPDDWRPGFESIDHDGYLNGGLGLNGVVDVDGSSTPVRIGISEFFPGMPGAILAQHSSFTYSRVRHEVDPATCSVRSDCRAPGGPPAIAYRCVQDTCVLGHATAVASRAVSVLGREGHEPVSTLRGAFGADLYFGNAKGTPARTDALDFFVEQNVDVVNASWGFRAFATVAEREEFALAVDTMARLNEITWVTGTGNDGKALELACELPIGDSVEGFSAQSVRSVHGTGLMVGGIVDEKPGEEGQQGFWPGSVWRDTPRLGVLDGELQWGRVERPHLVAPAMGSVAFVAEDEDPTVWTAGIVDDAFEDVCAPIRPDVTDWDHIIPAGVSFSAPVVTAAVALLIECRAEAGLETSVALATAVLRNSSQNLPSLAVGAPDVVPNGVNYTGTADVPPMFPVLDSYPFLPNFAEQADPAVVGYDYGVGAGLPNGGYISAYCKDINVDPIEGGSTVAGQSSGEEEWDDMPSWMLKTATQTEAEQSTEDGNNPDNDNRQSQQGLAIDESVPLQITVLESFYGVSPADRLQVSLASYGCGQYYLVPGTPALVPGIDYDLWLCDPDQERCVATSQREFDTNEGFDHEFQGSHERIQLILVRKTDTSRCSVFGPRSVTHEPFAYASHFLQNTL
ncbi:MAG: hypothetical protein ACI82G_000346 [Bradymonadia bacterium]